MNKKILIVGGCGYIGGFLTDYLTSKGHKITVYDNLLFEHRFLKSCDDALSLIPGKEISQR